MQCDKQRLRGQGRPNQMHNAMDKVHKINKKKGHWVNKQPHTRSRPCTRSHTCLMGIKRQIKNDVRKLMVIQSLWNTLLKLIGSSFY
jgi:hypothetical protein